MKMQKTGMFLSLAALLVLSSCGGGKYSDAKQTINRQINSMEVFSDSVEKAKDSGQIASALRRFQKESEGAQEKMEQMAKKYPELSDAQNPPEELKQEKEKLEELMPRFMQAMMKVAQQYGEEPQVQEILKQMQQSRVK
jgi:hypothetical protein